MAGIARLQILLGQSEMNGDGMRNDPGTTSVPNLSNVSYNGYILKNVFISPWVASTVYSTLGTIVYANGNEYELITTGTSTTGSGPSTTSSNITDGTCHWKYLRAALADVPAWAVSTKYYIGDVVYNDTTRKYYICTANGTSAASGGPTATTHDILDGTVRWKYNATFAGLGKLNPIYAAGVKIWNISTDKWQSLSQGTARQDVSNVMLGLGPQIPTAANLMKRYTAADTYLLKYTVSATPLGYMSSIYSWSLTSYESGVFTLLKEALNETVACMYDLLGKDTTGTNFSSWAASTSTASGIKRISDGSVWESTNASTTTSGTTAPTVAAITNGYVSDGLITWKYIHTVYDDVKILGLMEEQGTQDTIRSDWAYDYRYNKLNFWARFNDRLNVPVNSGLFTGYVETFNARNETTASAYCRSLNEQVQAGLKFSLNAYATFHNSNTAVTVTDATNYTKYGSRATWVKISDGATNMYANTSWYNTSQDSLHWTCSGTEEWVNRWYEAFDSVYPTPSTAGYTWLKTENTSFTVPSLTATASPAEKYNPQQAVTATVSATNFDGGDSVTNVSWYSDTDSTLSSSGANFTGTPVKYNGHVIRAWYRNAKGYYAYKTFYTHVVAPRITVQQGAGGRTLTPKHWMRAGIGASRTAERYINYVPNYAAYAASATPTNYAVVGASSPANSLISLPQHHDGVCFQLNTCLVFNGGTTDDATNRQSGRLASAADASVTRIAKITPYWKSNAYSPVYGSYRYTAGGGINGGGLTLAPSGITSTNDTPSTIALSSNYGNAVSIPVVTGTGGNLATTDQFDLTQPIIYALIKSGNSWELRWRDSGGSIQNKIVTGMTTITNDGYPDTLGFVGLAGFEGVGHEFIGYEEALSAAEVDAIIRELAVVDIPVIGSSTKTLDNATNITSGTVISPVLGISTVDLTPNLAVKEKVWIQVTDTAGNRSTTSLLVPNEAGTVLIQGLSTVQLAHSITIGGGAVTVPDAINGTSVVTLSSIGSLKEKVWVQIKDAAGNRSTSSLSVPNAVGDVIQLATGISTITLSAVSTLKEKVWVQIKDAAGNRTTTSKLVPSAAGIVQTSVSGGSTKTLADVTKTQSGTVFSGLSLVTMQAPLLLIPGSLLDPANWTGTAPAVGDQVYFPSTNGFTIKSNGEIVCDLNTGSYIVYYKPLAVDQWYTYQIDLVPGIYGTSLIQLIGNTYLSQGAVRISGASSVNLNTVIPVTTSYSLSSGGQTLTLDGVGTVQTGAIPIVATQLTDLMGLSGWFLQGYTGAVPAIGGSVVQLDTVPTAGVGNVLISGRQIIQLNDESISNTGGVLISGGSFRLLNEITRIQEGGLGVIPSFGSQVVTLAGVDVTAIATIYSTGIATTGLNNLSNFQRGAVFDQINIATETVDLNSIGISYLGFINSSTFIIATGHIREIEDSVVSNTSTIVFASGSITEVPDEVKERIYLDGGTVQSPLTHLKNFTILGGK